MNSSDEIIRELEFKRKALNERLMNSKNVAEANGIERELWALRAAIRFHKGKAARDPRRQCFSPVRQEGGMPDSSPGTNLNS